MFSDDDLLPISALQHLAFCERQCALIHIEGLWAENVLTAEGRVLHDRTDDPSTERRGDLRIARALRIRSLRLGISGVADVVEFHRIQQTDSPAPLWQPFPVEYKRGRPKPDHCDWVQLCAQALCLEEMLQAQIPAGAMYYGQPRRRQEVAFDTGLRTETENLCRRLHELIAECLTPPPVNDKRCENCSLLPLCLPKALFRSVSKYLDQALQSAWDEEAQ